MFEEHQRIYIYIKKTVTLRRSNYVLASVPLNLFLEVLNKVKYLLSSSGDQKSKTA